MGAFLKRAVCARTGRDMALIDTTVRLAKAGDVDRKMTDEKGLYLLITATGSKLWRLKYRIGGKEKKGTVGATCTVPTGCDRLPG